MIYKKEKHGYKAKKYIHFDDKRKFNGKTESYVSNHKKIQTHNFYPLIRYISKTEKYVFDESRPDSRPIKTKKRMIMYASHLDNFIYKYYGDKLNDAYNNWVRKRSIDETSIAYRSKKGEKGKSNIDHAAAVINKIKSFGSCYIMIGDFKGYFDQIKHRNLKDKVLKVMEIKGDQLPRDWYKVFRSVTKYSYYNQKLLHKYVGSPKELKQQKKHKYFLTSKDFRGFRTIYKPTTNEEKYGIPQGTAISAVLSNVYAIDFDEQVNQLVRKYGGIYRRYSDDFIVVIPENGGIEVTEFKSIQDDIYSLVKLNGMYIEKNKTKSFIYNRNCIEDFFTSSPTRMDYLGFVFDGETVEMRAKSPSKFYRHAKRLIAKAKNTMEKQGLNKLPYRKQIYRLYTDLGIDRRPYGNFITYATRSQEIFDEISPQTDNLMLKQVTHRREKINKMLGYTVSHTK
ncbi:MULTISPECIES: reverse transcriptase domain-containing protein [Sporosarcina]|uniref:Reverse transcriptase (RNA-dependent DNA polymerase) n=1 Tax=Sporosarcina newyorkensis TaxID=759851 RepID=A0A1T4Y1R0_9BACL|nr:MULTISPECIES: reverse transcriptase domain-containing protein [Sporosarcina]MBY0223480.1 RNA-dependent DNA polymerase [Sporosarcina aquimarina]SKA95732.1 Reverse transcriptase (RNA-dependent DNA polymerase) [Sporosarcina newyorkensis]